jgi:hypothetical protein
VSAEVTTSIGPRHEPALHDQGADQALSRSAAGELQLAAYDEEPDPLEVAGDLEIAIDDQNPGTLGE